jgi:hypothetical protein
MLIFGLLALPFAYLAVAIFLFVSRQRSGLSASLLAAVAAVAAGAWAILQSRSSTAAIGYLFLPLWGAMAGLLGLGGGRLWARPGIVARALAVACLAGALAIPVLLLVDGRRRNAPSRERVVTRRARDPRIAGMRAGISSMLATPGVATDTPSRLLRVRRADVTA